MSECSAVVLEVLSMGRRPLHCQNWMGIFAASVYTCFTKSAKPASYCRLHMFYSKSLYMSVTSTVMAGSRTSPKESTWDIVWLSNTSGLGRGTHSARFTRCLRCEQFDRLSLLSSHIAVLPGDHRLETPLPPQRLASTRSLRLHEPPEFLYCL